MSSKYKLEVCCTSYQDVANAFNAGANRVEFCSALSCGGVTPSEAKVMYVCQLCGSIVPVHVLIRPREGNFVYNCDEFYIMERDIEISRKAGASGVVLGALTPDGEIDVNMCRHLRQAAHGLSTTFSRAFDLVNDPVKALRQIIDLGFDRLLTSGCAPTALEGANTIRVLKKMAGNKITIMAGAGITEENFAEVISRTGVTEIHGSFRRQAAPPCGRKLPGLDGGLMEVNTESVRKITHYLKKL